METLKKKIALQKAIYRQNKMKKAILNKDKLLKAAKGAVKEQRELAGIK